MARIGVRCIQVAGRRTSIRLEPALWDALCDIALWQRTSVNQLITGISEQQTSQNLTAAIRVFIVEFYRRMAIRGRQPTVEGPRLSARE